MTVRRESTTKERADVFSLAIKTPANALTVVGRREKK